MAAVTLLLGMVIGLVEVDGTSACPTPSQVAEELRRLLPGDAAAAEPDRARVESQGGALQVSLSSAGRRVGTRRLAEGGSCEDLAGAAAVVIATWEAELRPGRLSLPNLRPPAPPAAHARTSLAWELGAALVGSLDEGAHPTGGGAVDVTLGPGGGRFAGRIGLVGLAPRRAPLGSGSVEWARPALSVGARFRLGGARVRVDLHLELLAALLIVGGSGYESSRREVDFDPGCGAGVRVSLRLGRVAPFVGVGVAGWLRRQTARISGIEPSASVDLPRFEALLSTGLLVGGAGAAR